MHAADPSGAGDAYGPFHTQATSRKLAPGHRLNTQCRHTDQSTHTHTQTKRETFQFLFKLKFSVCVIQSTDDPQTGSLQLYGHHVFSLLDAEMTMSLFPVVYTVQSCFFIIFVFIIFPS